MRRLIRYRGFHLASALFSLLYPSSCPVCKNPTDNISFAPLCTGCWESIQRYTGPACVLCASPLVSEYSKKCGECLQHPPFFSKVLNYGLYSGVLSEAVHLLKFSGLRRLAKPLGGLLTELPFPDMDGIVPVPVSTRTLRERGFNQTLLLSRHLSRHLGIPIHMNLLKKIRETPPQIGLGARERISNVRNSFKVNEKIDRQRLILLDDVMTTGATARECARALRKAGAQEVVVVTLARSPLT